jgi:hypothetical protein
MGIEEVFMIGEQISLDHVLKLPNGTPIWVEELEPRYQNKSKIYLTCPEEKRIYSIDGYYYDLAREHTLPDIQFHRLSGFIKGNPFTPNEVTLLPHNTTIWVEELDQNNKSQAHLVNQISKQLIDKDGNFYLFQNINYAKDLQFYEWLDSSKRRPIQSEEKMMTILDSIKHLVSENYKPELQNQSFNNSYENGYNNGKSELAYQIGKELEMFSEKSLELNEEELDEEFEDVALEQER